MFARKLWVSLDDGAGGWRFRAAIDESRARAAFADSTLAPGAAFVVIGSGACRLVLRGEGEDREAIVFFRRDGGETSCHFRGLSMGDCLFLIGGLYAVSPRRFARFMAEFEQGKRA